MRILIVSLIAFGLDQFTKFLVKQWIGLGDSIMILGDAVRFTHIENRGIIFGIMAGNNQFFFMASPLYSVTHVFPGRQIRNQNRVI